MRVYNMTSNNGNTVPNQFIIQRGKTSTFQSYNTKIAVCTPKYITLDSSALDYSRTTSIYLYKFLGFTREEIKQRIKDGSVKVRNLNKPSGV